MQSSYQPEKPIEETINELLERAKQAYQLNKYDLGLKYAYQALEIDPGFPAAHLMVGHCLWGKGEANASFEVFTKLIALHPEFPEAWLMRGNLILYEAQNPKEAILCYQKVLEFQPDHNVALFYYAEAQYSLGHLDQAEKLVRQALQANPEQEGSLRLLGKIEAKRGNHDQAKQCFLQALQHNPENLDNIFSYGRYLLVDRNLPEEAYPLLREAMRLDPNNKVVQEHFYIVLKAKKRFFRWYWSYQLWKSKLGFFGFLLFVAIFTVGHITGLFFLFIVIWIADWIFSYCIRRGWIF
ncbi:tetratricopeptide repeat protein [Risungbinella massiliensis]|uniref:tetratricopeptide repeat protein n=1 Tax=Risungbinella massiliensis TaxID=1329796 RepID=UPI0005CBB1AB|nr:tetratricopeptide repeat protein [Risungbinella massiliensis]